MHVIEPGSRAPLALMACGSALKMGHAVAENLGLDLLPTRDVWFASGEGKHVLEQGVRGADVYVLQQPVGPNGDQSVYDRLTMLLHAVDAARCADAARVTAVLPYFPGGRQDKRKGHVREGVSTGLFARCLAAAGADMVITVEPHNEAMIGCFDPRKVVFESVSLASTLCAFLLERGYKPDLVASTDVGGLERTREVTSGLDADLVALSKVRSAPGVVEHTTVIGNPAGRSVLVYDDIIDTAGSMCAAVEALWAAGATDAMVASAHCLMNGPAWDRMAELAEKAGANGRRFSLVGTSAIGHGVVPDYYIELPIEGLLASVIQRVNRRESVRALER
jgi:ribose-phosphate pyrophosphokinase